MSSDNYNDLLKLNHELKEYLRQDLREKKGIEPHPSLKRDDLYDLWYRHTQTREAAK